MEEIYEKIKNEINTIKSEQDKLNTLTEISENFRTEEEKLQQELDSIEDKESGFYKDLSEEINEKHESFVVANNDRMSKDREINQLISEKKEILLNEMLAKKQFIDENRNVNLEDVNLDELKAEKEKLEIEIELNNTTKEQFMQMTDSEKQAVRKAKEQYLNNKHRLDEINPNIELMALLDGKTPKERFIELSNLEKIIEKDFNIDNLDKMLKDINNDQEVARKKAEETEKKVDDEKITIKMVAARILKSDYNALKGSIIYNKVMDALDSGIEIEDVDEFIRNELIAMLRDNEDGKNNESIEKLKKEMNKAGIKYNDIKEIIEERKRNLEEEQKRKKEELEKNKLETAKVLEEKYGIKKGDILYDKIMEIISFNIEVSDISEIARTEFTTMLKTNKDGRYDKDIEKLQKEMDTAGIKYDDIIAEAKAEKEAEEVEIMRKAAEEEAKRKATEAEERRKAAEEKARREAEEKRKAELKKARQATPVKLIYSAKTDAYLLKDDVTNTTIVKSRKELETIDKKELQEKLGKDLTNVDIDHLQMLSMLDKDLAKEYVDSLSEIGKNKEERIAQMKELGISVDYKLKGIYDKNKYTERERDDILENANNAKAKGVATVEKGIKVNLLETANKIKNKAKTLFSNIQLLGKGNDDIIEQDKLEKKMAKKEARKNTFEKAVNNVKQFGEEIRANVNEEEAAIEAQRKADVKKVMAEEKEEQK